MKINKQKLNEFLNLADYFQGQKWDKLCLVFDLDSTLYNVTPRTQSLLEDFLSQKISAAHKQYTTLKEIQFHENEWGLREAFQRVNITIKDPIFLEFREFWRQHFFSSEALKYDEAYPGAMEFVLQCHSLGAEILYLTGRDKENMFSGTLKSLKKHQLPVINEGDNLYMKPEKTWGQDADYKARTLTELTSQSDKNFILFDNEPAILNMCSVKNKNVDLVYTDTVHSGAEDILPHIYHLKGWEKELMQLQT